MVEQRGLVSQAKKWIEPQLTILTRSKNEESVLTACKQTGSSAADANVYQGCAAVMGCTYCIAYTTS